VGNLVKKAIKKRDKKYDPYKRLKKEHRELVKHTEKVLMQAVEYDEKGDIKLDDAGKPVFKDSMQWETDGAQMMAIWTCHKAALEHHAFPPQEIDAAFDNMMLYAREYRETNKPYTLTMPINYFVGTFHILNFCNAHGIFESDKKMKKAVYELAVWFEDRIKMYQEVKRREQVQDEASPEDILKLPNGRNNSFEEFQNKVLEFKK
jgi:hypothetical protein